MKFSKFGRIALALAASLVIGFGTQSCHYDYTEAYVFVTGSQYNQIQSYKEDNEAGVLSPAPGGAISTGGSNPIRAVLLTGGRYVYVLNEGSPSKAADGTITWTGGNIALFSVGGDGSLVLSAHVSKPGAWIDPFGAWAWRESSLRPRRISAGNDAQHNTSVEQHQRSHSVL